MSPSAPGQATDPVAGSTAAAAVSLDIRLSGVPDGAAQKLRDARAAIDARDVAGAQRSLQEAQSGADGHPEYLRLLGILRQMQERPREAVDALRSALEKVPGDALILTNLGTALRDAGEIDAAIASLRRACELAPGLAAGWYNLGRTLADVRRNDEAHEAFERAVHCDPTHTRARIQLGSMLRSFGRIDEAAAAYRQALSQGAIEAWAPLGHLKTMRLSAADTRELQDLFAQPGLEPARRSSIGFTLVKALEDQGHYAEAFAVLCMTNALKRRLVEWDASAASHQVERILEAFEKPAATAAASTSGNEVIFIVSMPRAGSTLTEQILASHPDVEGAGELPDLGDVLGDESKRRGQPFPEWTVDAKPGDWRRLGEEYLERSARWRRTRPRFTDKALSNWQLVGAAMAMLPGARFVDCRRDPVETCLSCYRQLFGKGQAFTYDLGELASFWRDYERAMRFWSTRYPAALRTQHHERLVAYPEAEIRALLAFCALPFDAACLRHYDTPRHVRTLSAAQVREPLRQDTARAWRYGDLLAPLRSALGTP